MNNKVKILVKTNSNKFTNYLVYHSIKYESLIKNKDNYNLIVDSKDYKLIKRRYDTKIIRYYGINYYISLFKRHKYMFISFFMCLCLLKLLANTIFEINIVTDDTNLKNELIKILNLNDIKVYKKKKNFNELNLIKKKILNDYSDLLEWIEITEKGCKYIINVTPKINSKNNKSNDIKNIIATKNGVIKYITVNSGTKVKELNEYVKKGDILISSDIINNNQVIDKVNASGDVYAEVWYLAKISVPFEYNELHKTGKKINHYYIELFNKKITLMGKYNTNNLKKSKKLLIDKPYLKFKLYKEILTEYKSEKIVLNEHDALNKGLSECNKYIINNLKENEYVISKNVLKKEANSSKIYLEVFYKIYENIGTYS